MREHGGGAIVNTASVNGLTPGEGRGLFHFQGGRYQHDQVFRQGMRAVQCAGECLLPGLTKTKFAGALFTNEDIYKQALSQIPMRRHAEPKKWPARSFTWFPMRPAS